MAVSYCDQLQCLKSGNWQLQFSCDQLQSSPVASLLIGPGLDFKTLVADLMSPSTIVGRANENGSMGLDWRVDVEIMVQF